MASAPTVYSEARNGVGGIGSAHAAAIAGSDLLLPFHSFLHFTSAFLLTLTAGPVSVVTSLWNGIDSSLAVDGSWVLSFPPFKTGSLPIVIVGTSGTDMLTGDFYETSVVTASSATIDWFNTAGTAMPQATRGGFESWVLVVGQRDGVGTSAEHAALFEGSAT